AAEIAAYEAEAGAAENAVLAAEEGVSALPSTLARVIPNGIPAVNLGAPGAADVFVTTPEAIEGLDSAGIAQALTIPESPSGFQVIQFSTPEEGSPLPFSGRIWALSVVVIRPEAPQSSLFRTGLFRPVQRLQLCHDGYQTFRDDTD